MYPYLRLAGVLVGARRAPAISPLDETVLRLRVLPGDIDLYPELNNGRHLTMMDLGRIDLAARSGVLALIRRKRWGLVVGGASLRYRRRLPFMARYELHTRWVGTDEKWLYFHQQTMRKGAICSAALVRAGILSREGLIAPERLASELPLEGSLPCVPDWVEAWIQAEGMRPWPASGTRANQTG